MIVKNLSNLAAVFLMAGILLADEPAKAKKSPEEAATEAKASPTQATFLITGLHYPPCTRTVEASLKRTRGIKSVTVDWRTQTPRSSSTNRCCRLSRCPN